MILDISSTAFGVHRVQALYRKSLALFETLNFSEAIAGSHEIASGSTQAVQLLQKLMEIEPENLAAKERVPISNS